LAYAFGILGDYQLAEDAAQEAFIGAFRDLPALREPLAFPGWLRSVVFKQCDRFTRQNHMALVSLETVPPKPPLIGTTGARTSI
jgi:DNA-directed RNA polymerase specialized sigma24 family protein